MYKKILSFVSILVLFLSNTSYLWAQGLVEDSQITEKNLSTKKEIWGQEKRVSIDQIKSTPLADLIEEWDISTKPSEEIQGDKLILPNGMKLKGIVKSGKIEAKIAPETSVDIAGSSDALKASDIGITPVSKDEEQKAINDASNESNVSFFDTLQSLILPTANAAETKAKPNNQFTFELGTKWKHLIFSKPVEVKVRTPYIDGQKFRIRVRHTDDKNYNTSWLTLDANATCDKKWWVSNESNIAYAKDGYIKFYTCWASSFTINTTGGTTVNNGLKLVVGDCAQTQITYINSAQVYGGAVPWSGCGTPSSWPALRIGTTTYANAIGTSFTSANTRGYQNGTTYTAITDINVLHTNGLYYNLKIDWKYNAPDAFFTWKWTINIPNGNTDTVKFYYAMDSSIGWDDAGDSWFYEAATQKVGIRDSADKIANTFRVTSGLALTAYEVKWYATINSDTASGLDYDNSLAGAADNGLGLQWTLGSTPGEYSATNEWAYIPYGSSATPDLQTRLSGPTAAFSVNQQSNITATAYNPASGNFTGNMRIRFTLPTGFTGSSIATSNNGWSCAAFVPATRIVDCTKNFTLNGNATNTVTIPLTPGITTGGTNVTYTAAIARLSGTTENPTNNNTASRVEPVSSTALDTTAPTFTSVSIADNKLIGGGTFDIAYGYSDNIAINSWSIQWSLYKWDTGTSSYILYTPSTVLTFTGTTLTGTTAKITGIPMWKYRLDTTIVDTSNNQTTNSRTFYVDALLMNVSADTYDIDNISISPPALEQIITVSTVWAAFTIKINGTTLTQWGDSIGTYTGSTWWGYHTESGGIYTVTPIAPSGGTVYSQWASINTNGQYNVYTFKLKYSGRVDDEQAFGDYTGNMSITITGDYP